MNKTIKRIHFFKTFFFVKNIKDKISKRYQTGGEINFNGTTFVSNNYRKAMITNTFI